MFLILNFTSQFRCFRQNDRLIEAQPQGSETKNASILRTYRSRPYGLLVINGMEGLQNLSEDLLFG